MRPGLRREERRRARPRPGGADHVDPLPGPDRPGLAGRREAAPDAIGRGGHAASDRRRRFARGSARRRPRRWRACCRRDCPVHTWRRTSVPPASATATYVRPTGFCRAPAVRSGDAGHGAGDSRPVRARPPVAIATARLRGDRAVRREDICGNADEVALELVRVGDEPAEVAGAGTRGLGDQVADEPARAGLDRARRCRPRGKALARAERASPGATSGSSATALPALGLDRRIRRREQPRLGDAVPPERTERRAVQREVGHAGRSRSDLDRLLTGERQRPPSAITDPPAPSSGSSLPSTQTLSHARPPSIVTTRLTPLNATVTFRVCAAVLPCGLAAVTVIDQRPAVSSNGRAERAVLGDLQGDRLGHRRAARGLPRLRRPASAVPGSVALTTTDVGVGRRARRPGWRRSRTSSPRPAGRR